MSDAITSANNPEIKAVAALHKRSERDATGLFLIEGGPEIERALGAGIKITTLLWASGTQIAPSLAVASQGVGRSVEVGDRAFEKIAYGRDGVVAVARTPGFGLKQLNLTPPELIVVVEAIEKPGNLGAILRSADGAGAAVIAVDPTTDIVNPNVVRASLGTLFTVEVAVATSEATIAFLRGRGIQIAGAVVEGGNPPWDFDLRQPTALAIGGETSGLTNPWIEAADHLVTLPMKGRADSLNASVAAATLMFEAVRQRSMG